MRNLSKRHIVLVKLKAPSSRLAIEPSPHPGLVVYLVFQPATAGSSRHLSLGFSVRMRKRFSRHFSCWNLIKKINLWTFDSRRDTKYNGARSPIFCSVRVSRKPKNSNCTQTLIDGTHEAAGELPPKATESHREIRRQSPPVPTTNSSWECLGPLPRQSCWRSCSQPGTGCRMSCKLAQLIYFNTNLTLIVPAPHFISLRFTELHSISGPMRFTSFLPKERAGLRT